MRYEKISPEEWIRPLTASFADSGIEEEYRRHFFIPDRRQYIIALVIAMIPMMLFLFTDRLLFGASMAFILLLILRLSFNLLSAVVIILLLKMNRIRSVDLLLFCWGILYYVTVTVIYATRPPEYMRSAYLDILMLMVPYLLFNIRFMLQITPQLLYCGTSLFILAASDVPAVTFNAMLITYIFSNVMGTVVAWRFQTYRRRQFSHYRREKKLNEELKATMGNLRVLRGLMPICSRCKKIRDEEGYWKRLEEYIEQHSEAQFSHSICDKCAEELYGKHSWYKK